MKKLLKLESLSLFVPCLNEENNVGTMIEELVGVAKRIAKKFEVIVINDGSKDKTSEVVKKKMLKYKNLILVEHEKNKGYGASLRTGFNKAKYEWVFFTDGDRQFRVSELEQFIPYTKSHEVIIGYRKKRAEGLKRVFIAGILKLVVNIIFRLHVIDIDCAFKLIKTKRVQQLPLMSTGALISTELLYRLKKKHLNFKQLSVTHLKRKFGNPTGSSLRVLLHAAIEFAKLYWHLKFNWQR